MNSTRLIFALAVVIGATTAAFPATYSDPSWPCIQRKVEKLSLGIMWPHPVPDEALDAETEPAAQQLAAKLSLRRISLEETKPLVAEFVKNHPSADLNLLGKIFKRVFEKLSHDREVIIGGIKKYSFKQIALSKSIDETRVSIATLSKASEPDFDKIDALEEKLDWDERVYKDRARSLTYVCETPVLLEKRLFAISKLLQSHIRE